VRYLTVQARVTGCLLTVLSFLVFPALAVGHTVSLSWDPSISQVIGYNVYRGADPNGPYTKLNSTLDVNTAYADTTVLGGQTYYYVTTAVDSQNKESGYSNQTKAVVPGGSGSESAVYSFSGSGGDAKLPYAGLILDKAGNLYGTTEFGGAYNQGTVFEVIPASDGSWTESVLYSFTGGVDGGQPYASLILDATGNLYGTTTFGGGGNCSLGCGTVFKLTPGSGAWTESVLYTFTGGSDGGEPYARLVSDAAGNLYSTTLLGGDVGTVCSTGCGTVFKLTPGSGAWTESVLYTFAGGPDGASPYDGLTFDPAGSLYGTAYAGGAYGYGLVFKLTPAAGGGWTESVLHAFTGGYGGKYSYGDVLLDAAGNLYGTAFQGGARGFGAVFELFHASKGRWRERVLHTFGNAPAATPVAGLVMDPAGNLYGTTMLGASQSPCGGGCGTLFKLEPGSGGSWTFKVLHLFGHGTDGYHPTGNLVLDQGGNLYGTTQAGGAQGAGLVFEIMH
jgi:uncharacterized repeat protein (TIGR03803 family)